jgi:hypothetical protein
MDAMEERLIRLEKQVRFYRVVTISIVIALVLFFGWLGYMILTVDRHRNPIGPTYGAGVVLLDTEGHGFASLNATREGVIQVSPERWHFDASETRPTGKASITLDVSGDTPALTLTDVSGKEVWHAP